ncbi:MAG: TnpV protein [Monoglobales bacterium]
MRIMAEITYRTMGDYQIPELTVPQEEYAIGKYGMMRRTYLRNHRRSLYSIMLMNGTLLSHLKEIDTTALEQVQRIVSQMAKTEGVTEVMKSKDPLRWTGLMNNFLHSAEETVLRELVYS